MKKNIIILAFLVSSGLYAQSILGTWKSINEETNKEESFIEIYEENGKFYGKVLQVLDPKKKATVCTKCKGQDKNKPIEGLIIIKGLTRVANEWSGGKILDPKNGKTYKCVVTLPNQNTLKLRGYIGFSVFGRTATWYGVRK